MRALALGTLGPLALLAFAAAHAGSGGRAERILHRVDSGTHLGQYGKYNPGDDGADTDGR